MNTPLQRGFWALSEKEKQTLRLIVCGHDAKSSARKLGLSVHTINERLRDARRKMAVSSSREAARMLLEAEGGTRAPAPDLFGDKGIREDATDSRMDEGTAPTIGVGRALRRPRIILGGSLMTLALGFLVLAALPQSASVAPPSSISHTASNAEVVDAARQWLTLLDQARWDESHQATGTAFRGLNTAEVWAATSEKVRVPLGAMVSRTFVSEENLPAPPAGYEVVKFRTRFSNKAEAVETVTLDREDGRWRVVGVTIG
jgi:DNA-binding CsgD family transcriptional regulator